MAYGLKASSCHPLMTNKHNRLSKIGKCVINNKIIDIEQASVYDQVKR